MSKRALAAAALLVLSVSRLDAQTVVFRTLNATLTEGSLAGTRFPVGISYDADQVAQVGESFSPRGEVTFLGTAMVGLNPWLRLVRHEPTDLATVTAAVSADGVTWTVLGQTFVNMSMSVEMGIAVTSHDTTQLNTAVIDHVHVRSGEL
jgi:hypothetical protein